MKIITELPETPFEEGAEYSLVITPAAGDMAGYSGADDDTLSNEEGAPLSGSVSVEDGAFSVSAFSYNGVEENDGEVFPNKTAAVNVFVGTIQ